MEPFEWISIAVAVILGGGGLVEVLPTSDVETFIGQPAHIEAIRKQCLDCHVNMNDDPPLDPGEVTLSDLNPVTIIRRSDFADFRAVPEHGIWNIASQCLTCHYNGTDDAYPPQKPEEKTPEENSDKRAELACLTESQ
ncbi:MAG: hypothetical protein KAJ10_05375 [Thermodesulfovibrionia bacterium]|nr:hypothetical protein [Thermodesulfovibrionia bacterium]